MRKEYKAIVYYSSYRNINNFSILTPDYWTIRMPISRKRFITIICSPCSIRWNSIFSPRFQLPIRMQGMCTLDRVFLVWHSTCGSYRILEFQQLCLWLFIIQELTNTVVNLQWIRLYLTKHKCSEVGQN